jgi:hypothetical protein
MSDDLLDTDKLTEEFKLSNMLQIHVTRQEAEEIAHNRRDLTILTGANTVLEKRILESACGILDILHKPKKPVRKRAPRKTEK